MKTFVEITGEISWTMHLFQTDSFRGQEFWKITVAPDKNGMEVFKASGLTHRLRGEKGEETVTLRCPTSKMFKDGRVDFKPPVVLVNGESYDIEEHGLIGNGSKAIVKVETYKFGTDGETGGRLYGVNITDLIKYERPQEEESDSEKATKEAKAW